MRVHLSHNSQADLCSYIYVSVWFLKEEGIHVLQHQSVIAIALA